MAEIAFGVAGTIIEKLGSLAFDEVSLARGAKSDLDKLRKTTTILKAVLIDAEKKQNQDEQLRAWLARLEDVFDDTLEVIDEFECESLRRRVVTEFGTVARKVRRFFSSSNPIVYRFKIAHRVKEIRKMLDEIGSEMVRFELISSKIGQDYDHGRVVRSGDREIREISHSYINPLEVIGRDEEIYDIVDLLLQENDSVSKLIVIPIVGLGGLGKTTLARSVYNDERVVERFEMRLWVCPPLDFDLTETIREILKSAFTSTSLSVSGQSVENAKSVSSLSLEQCQVFLRRILNDKTFLLVLDDVWSDDHKKWVDLRDFLKAGSRESKVLVTTRNVSVASAMTTTPPYCLQSLSDEDSLALFLKYAFGGEELADRHQHLKKIGRDIVKRCCGVPLAARALGSSLHGNTNIDKWMFVRDHRMWEIERESDDPILSALKLSYTSMPTHLKQCFVLCSCFSKHNSIVTSIDLIMMWMALGILPNDEKFEMEDFGKSYFEDLCTRSFFQRLDNLEENTSLLTRDFEMHDLIHDLVRSIIQRKTFTIINGGTNIISENVRYLTVSTDINNSNKTTFPSFHNPKKVVSLQLDANIKPNIDDLFISTCIKRLTKLRIFKADFSSFEVLPSSIGTLKHLRYLDLSDNKRIKRLPDSVCKLQNLQSLGLEGCDELEELPRNIKSLVSLRSLSVTSKQAHFPENGIGSLRSLQIMLIYNCKNLESLPRDIRHNSTLRTLLIDSCEKLNFANEPSSEGAPQKLQILHISLCAKLSALPNWLPNLTSLKRISIGNCQSLTSLPEGIARITSLTHFEVSDCKELEEKCRRGVGEYWPKISHVPFVKIGYE